MMNDANVLIEGRHLTKAFPLGRKQKVHAVTDVSLSLYQGETLGLVGESGCGKSTLGRLLIHTIRPTAGQLFLQGRDVTALDDRAFHPFRRQLQMIFQDPQASLDPRMRVLDLVAEPLLTWGLAPSRKAAIPRVLELLAAVGVPGEYLYRYPWQFSGGQCQRIGIARALATEPALIVCDEPVSALDASVQNQILNLLRQLRQERSLTLLMISHDLNVVRYLSDRICVMYLGRICEIGPAETVFAHPLHPYTRLLISSVPLPDPRIRREEAELLSGETPSPVSPPSGCPFRTRCPRAAARCGEEVPALRDFGGRQAACHFAAPEA